jgi:hypothetical protein
VGGVVGGVVVGGSVGGGGVVGGAVGGGGGKVGGSVGGGGGSVTGGSVTGGSVSAGSVAGVVDVRRGVVRLVVAVVSSGAPTVVGASVGGATNVVVVGASVVVAASGAVVVAARATTAVGTVLDVEVGGGRGGPGVPEVAPRQTNAKVSRVKTSTPITIRATVRPDGRCITLTVARVGGARRSP